MKFKLTILKLLPMEVVFIRKIVFTTIQTQTSINIFFVMVRILIKYKNYIVQHFYF